MTAGPGGILHRSPPIARLILLASLGLYACGGGGSSSGGGGGSMNEITWPSRDGGTTTELPPAILTGRVVFQSQSGESCCVAVDPALLSGSAQRGLAILNNLPIGPATVTVAGFTTAFAPTTADIATVCSTVPASAAQPCDLQQVAAPAFMSPPLSVTIIGGAQTNIGDVPMEALPFLYDFSPAQDTDAAAPVQFALTVVDAVTGIRSDSVNLEVNFTVPDPQAPSGSPFRVISKRVSLNLRPCADGSGQPCSAGGDLELEGFAATGTAPELPEGQVEAHFTAENLADPRRDLDFRYSFNVLATPTATATATAPPATAAAGDAAPAADAGEAGAPTASSDVPATDESAGRPRAGGRSGTPVPTPTSTPIPGAVP